jgi:hypothetical protein
VLDRREAVGLAGLAGVALGQVGDDRRGADRVVDGVAAGAADQVVVAVAAREPVVAVPARETVGTGTAGELVGAAAAADQVVAAAAEHALDARPDVVGLGGRAVVGVAVDVERDGAVAPRVVDRVEPAAARVRVGAGGRDQHVGAAAAGDAVVAVAVGDGHREGAADGQRVVAVAQRHGRAGGRRDRARHAARAGRRAALAGGGRGARVLHGDLAHAERDGDAVLLAGRRGDRDGRAVERDVGGARRRGEDEGRERGDEEGAEHGGGEAGDGPPWDRPRRSGLSTRCQ